MPLSPSIHTIFFRTGHHKSSSHGSPISQWSADWLLVCRDESFLQAGCTQQRIQMPCCSRRKKIRAEVIISFTTTTLHPLCKCSDNIPPLTFFFSVKQNEKVKSEGLYVAFGLDIHFCSKKKKKRFYIEQSIFKITAPGRFKDSICYLRWITCKV